MNWKAALLICLALFAALIVINAITTTLISLQSPLSPIIKGNSIVLNVNSSGDPIDDPWPPHSPT